MRISLREQIGFEKQTDKLLGKMTQDNELSYQYGKKTVGRYLKDKKHIEKYNRAMKEFLTS